MHVCDRFCCWMTDCPKTQQLQTTLEHLLAHVSGGPGVQAEPNWEGGFWVRATSKLAAGPPARAVFISGSGRGWWRACSPAGLLQALAPHQPWSVGRKLPFLARGSPHRAAHTVAACVHRSKWPKGKKVKWNTEGQVGKMEEVTQSFTAECQRGTPSLLSRCYWSQGPMWCRVGWTIHVCERPQVGILGALLERLRSTKYIFNRNGITCCTLFCNLPLKITSIS